MSGRLPLIAALVAFFVFEPSNTIWAQSVTAEQLAFANLNDPYAPRYPTPESNWCQFMASMYRSIFRNLGIVNNQAEMVMAGSLAPDAALTAACLAKHGKITPDFDPVLRTN
jgi:hypothetical protein